MAPLCCSQRSPHRSAAALAESFQRRLKDVEPGRAADGSGAGRLVRGRCQEAEPPPPWPIGATDRATGLCWAQLCQGAASLGDAVGAAPAGGEEPKQQKAQSRICPASPAIPESSTIHMGDSPWLRRPCAVHAPCRQRVCKESKWQANVPASCSLPETYAIHMGPPPDQPNFLEKRGKTSHMQGFCHNM